MIKDIFYDLEKAIENKAYFSALALALIIPDICGKIAYKNLNNKEKYIKWFDDWVYPYLEVIRDEDVDFAKFDELVKFDGEVCYALRCSFLHAGNYDLNNGKNNVKITRFKLCVSDSEFQFGDADGVLESDGEIVEVHKRINIENLLEYFKRGINDYIKENGDSSNEYGTIKIIKI